MGTIPFTTAKELERLRSENFELKEQLNKLSSEKSELVVKAHVQEHVIEMLKSKTGYTSTTMRLQKCNNCKRSR